MQIIGVTGGIGSGKSTVTQIITKQLQEHGYTIEVLDLDKIAAQVRDTEEVQNALRTVFHLAEDAQLHKSVIRALAFSSDLNYSLFNGTIFPFILNELQSRLQKIDGAGLVDCVLIDAATIFESKLDLVIDFSCIVTVYTNLDIRMKRIQERAQTRNWSENQIKFIINKQIDPILAKQKSHVVIENNFSKLEDLESAVINTINSSGICNS